METSRLRGGSRDPPGRSLGTARSAANRRAPLSGVLQSFSSYSRQAAATTTRPARFIKSGGCAASKTEPCRQSSQQERLFFFSYVEKAIGRRVFKSRVIGLVSRNLFGGEITIDHAGISATRETFRAWQFRGKKTGTTVIRTIK